MGSPTKLDQPWDLDSDSDVPHYTPKRRQVDGESSSSHGGSSSSSSEDVEGSTPELANSESSSLEWSDLFSSYSSENESTSSDEESSEEKSSASQSDSQDKAFLDDPWWTGVNDSQTSSKSAYDVEKVPYSSNTQITLRKVCRIITLVKSATSLLIC